MPERMIPCPECEGSGRHPHAVEINGEPTTCGKCKTAGTIPDRRQATPNDRAVERIKAWAKDDQDDIMWSRACDAVMTIIREEAERHE